MVNLFSVLADVTSLSPDSVIPRVRAAGKRLATTGVVGGTFLTGTPPSNGRPGCSSAGGAARFSIAVFVAAGAGAVPPSSFLILARFQATSDGPAFDPLKLAWTAARIAVVSS